jgi:hypothetical protein
MADYAKQAPTRPAPAFLSQPLSVEPTVVDLTAEEPVSTAHNTGKLTGAAPLQNATPKPVFRMKRTGHANLPPGINTPTRDGSTPLSPATYTPTPPAATLVVLDSEPEPAKIVSDILPPTHPPPSTPMLDSISAPSIPNPSPASDGTRKTKYATDEERRKATSLALKRRFLTRTLLPRARRLEC